MDDDTNTEAEQPEYEAVKSDEVAADEDLPAHPEFDPDASNVANPDANLPPVAPDSYTPPTDGHSQGNLIGNEAPPVRPPVEVDQTDWQRQEAENIQKAREDAGVTDGGGAAPTDFGATNAETTAKENGE